MNQIILLLSFFLITSKGYSQLIKKGPDNLRIYTIENLAGAPKLVLKIRNIIILETPPDPRSKTPDGQNTSKNASPYIDNIYRVLGFQSGFILLDKHQVSEDLYAYNAEGKFIWKAIRGKGPGEFNRITYISVSPSGQRIAVMDANSVSEFGTDGTFLSKRRSPLRSINQFNYLTDNEGVIQAPNFQNYPFQLYLWKDSAAIPIGIKRKINERAIESGEQNIQIEKNVGVLYTNYLTDTIYRVSTIGIKPMFVLDFGKNGIRNLNPREVKSSMNPGNLLAEKKLSYKTGSYHVDHGLIYFLASDGKQGYHCEVNMESGQINTLPYSSPDIFGIHLFSRLMGYCIEGMLWSGNAGEIGDLARSGELGKIIHDESLLIRLKKLTENDNPVLIIAE